MIAADTIGHAGYGIAEVEFTVVVVNILMVLEIEIQIAEGLEGLLSFGRQGLFAHDNTHHALFMAYSAVNCLDDQGRFDRARWQDYRQIFKTHVVED